MVLGLLCAVVVLLLLPFFGGQTLLPSDSLKSLPLSRFGEREFFEHFHIVQWIPSMFGGMPCYASVMVTPSYLVSVIYTWGIGQLLSLFKDPLAQHVFHLLLLGCGTLLYLRRMNVSRAAAAIVALNLVLMPTLTGLIGAGHTIKLWTVCWMPLLLWLLEGVLRSGRFRDLGLGGLLLGLMLSAKHVQMSWYFLILAGLYALVRIHALHREKGQAWLPPLGRAMAFVALGLAVSAFLYLPVLEYSSLSLRGSEQAAVSGGDYAAAYSYPLGDLASWWIADAKGYGGSTYWGALEYTAFPLYMGAVWLVPFLLAFWQKRWSRLAAWLLPALFLLLIGLGKNSPLHGLFVDALPLYAKFRAHMWAIAPAQMLLLFVSADGWDVLLDRRGAQAKSLLSGMRIPLAAGVLLLLAALSVAGKPSSPGDMGQGTSWSNPQDTARLEMAFARQGMRPSAQQLQEQLNRMRQERSAMAHESLALSAALAALALLAVWLLRRGTFQEPVLLLCLATLIAADAIPQARQVMNFQPRVSPDRYFQAGGVLGHLAALSDKHEFRIWPKEGYGHNEAVWHGLHSIEGYHGAKLALIQEVLSRGRNASGDLHPTLLDILNVRYVISRSEIPGLKTLGQAQDGLLLENEDALPRIHFPSGIRVLPGEEHLEALLESSFDPARTVLLEARPQELAGTLSAASGSIRSYRPQEIVYSLQSEGPSLALLSEIWVPEGWSAELNGEEVPILRANHLLRAVALPEAGSHELILRYTAPGWHAGLAISLAGFLLCGGLLLADRRRSSARPLETAQS